MHASWAKNSAHAPTIGVGPRCGPPPHPHCTPTLHAHTHLPSVFGGRELARVRWASISVVVVMNLFLTQSREEDVNCDEIRRVVAAAQTNHLFVVVFVVAGIRQPPFTGRVPARVEKQLSLRVPLARGGWRTHGQSAGGQQALSLLSFSLSTATYPLPMMGPRVPIFFASKYI